jgi:hypothetical protein
MLSNATGGGIGGIVLTAIMGIIKNYDGEEESLCARRYLPAIFLAPPRGRR